VTAVALEGVVEHAARALEFYDLDELRAKLRMYVKKCMELADAVEKPLREAGRK
jgi:hypothetical protein